MENIVPAPGMDVNGNQIIEEEVPLNPEQNGIDGNGEQNNEEGDPANGAADGGIHLKERLQNAAIGATVGVAVVFTGLAVIGLGPLGPVAGGIFASNMGAGLTAGSAMSVLQSAAMTGTVYGWGAGFAAAAGFARTPSANNANGNAEQQQPNA